ncbi:hypothetical protein SLEP1_g19162 [Rubroshorea leprosula]|nr:hypothetical protein SLEP1_g19162 [Rubroshorea leprosula]
MSSYGYPYTGYCSQNGEGSYMGDWNSDHVCRPVLIDAEGRKRPIISYNIPNNCEYYVLKTEAVVQGTVDSGYDYKQSLPTRVEPARTYGGVADGKWVRPSSPVRRSMEEKLNTRSPVNGFPPKANEVQGHYKTSYPTRPLRTNNGCAVELKSYIPPSRVTYSEPVYGDPQKFDEYNEDEAFPMVEPVPTHGSVPEEKWGRPKPGKFNENHTGEKWQRPSSPIREYEPDKVNEFLDNVQIEASQPRFPPSRARYWPQAPQVTTRYGYDGDLGNKSGQSTSDPPMVTTGGRSRPSPATWASAPEGSLTKPTNDINTAMGYLLESAKPSPPPTSRVAMPISTGLSADSYTSTIDSREAARRYGNFNFPNNPKNEPYTKTIDSREAARKYGGQRV